MTAGPFAALQDHLATLGESLAQWEDRDQAADKAAARRAGSAAVDAIDAMLRDLYLVRGRLVQETRAEDDATDARVDALLRQHREGGAT